MSLYPNFSFDIKFRSKRNAARVGVIHTPHGDIQTPNFIFCGTKANIKGMFPSQVEEVGAEIILANTYHLMIQPGVDLIAEQGGIHKFMGWNKPMLTDSGGFQIFSMQYGGVADEVKGRLTNKKRKNTLLEITEHGAVFRKYTDGQIMEVTPEISIDAQRKIGADLIVAFDELTSTNDSKAYTKRSMERTHRWEDRSLEEFKRGNNGTQALYGVVQGGVFKDLREESCKYTADHEFFGTAIGGCLGKDEDETKNVVSWCTPIIHPDRPVHLLGMGKFKDIFDNVRNGIDTFDCVIPSRMARHGMALIKGHPAERINLINAQYRHDSSPLDDRMEAPISNSFSKAYIHHLLKAKETLAGSILTKHNFAVLTQLMKEVREAILNDTLDELEKEWLGK